MVTKVRPGMELVTYDIFRTTENGKTVSGLWVHTQTTVIPEKMLHKATEVIPTPDNTTTKSRYVANGSTQRPVIDRWSFLIQYFQIITSNRSST